MQVPNAPHTHGTNVFFIIWHGIESWKLGQKHNNDAKPSTSLYSGVAKLQETALDLIKGSIL